MRLNSPLQCVLLISALCLVSMSCLGADEGGAVPAEPQADPRVEAIRNFVNENLPIGLDSSTDEDIKLGIDAVQDFIIQTLPPGMQSPAPEEWERFWSDLTSLLADGSLEDIASFKATAHLALGYLAAMPELQSETDWLRERTDFIDMADLAVGAIPTAPPVAAPDINQTSTLPPPPAVEPRLMPAIHESASTTELPAGLEQQRRSLIRNYSVWEAKLAKRPLPANAEKLIPVLKAIFASEGVPAELVWIAEVESSLNPDAKSPAGAVGLFQFMPATAERFGLRTGLFDERKDPEKSARAAARYLKILYRQMGSWSLALASYNAGEGRVRRAQEKRNARSFDEIAADLPVETQMYVPKIAAIIALRENANLADLPAPAAGF